MFGAWLYAFPVLSQGSCLQSEERLSLQINLSARGDQPADLDKLKPYVIEHILVLLVAPAAEQDAFGGCLRPFWFMPWRQFTPQACHAARPESVVHKTVFQYEKRNMHWYFIYLFIYFSLHMNYIIECLCGRALSKQNNIYFLTDLTITELLYFLWSRIQFFKRISLTREWIQLKDFDYFAVSKEPSNERHGKYDISPDFVFFLWFLHQIRTKVRIILATVVYRTTFWSILLYLPVFWCHFAWAVILILLYYTWITFVYIILIPLCFFQQGNQK